MSGLGRIEPPDWQHVEKYALADLEQAARPVNVPVVLGINWYAEFDNPEQDAHGNYWIARDGHLTTIRGGHCICTEPQPKAERDPASAYWTYYDQGDTPQCVGYGSSRMSSLTNHKLYDPHWLYAQAQKVDGMPLPHDGSTVRAGLSVLKKHGHVVHTTRGDEPPSLAEGIKAYRWAKTVEEIHAALGTVPGFVTLLQSWGKAYPHRVRVTDEVLDRLLSENAEAGVVTDR